eukprot:COSAG02_NODE_363_length_23785_cov_21.830828_21_plen_93_part_00
MEVLAFFIRVDNLKVYETKWNKFVMQSFGESKYLCIGHTASNRGVGPGFVYVLMTHESQIDDVTQLLFGKKFRAAASRGAAARSISHDGSTS